MHMYIYIYKYITNNEVSVHKWKIYSDDNGYYGYVMNYVRPREKELKLAAYNKEEEEEDTLWTIMGYIATNWKLIGNWW
jgi:hypothetical protein